MRVSTEPPSQMSTGPAVDAPDLAVANTALRALTLAAQDMRHAFADAIGVGLTDATAMSYLAAEGPLTPRDLARRLSVATSSVTTVVDRLERAGLAYRRHRPDDRRTHDVVLTDRGVQALAWGRRFSEAALVQLGADLPEAERVLLRAAEALRAQADRMRTEGAPFSS